ncbi:MAG: DUF3943 domain-containing protein, partial [Thermoanaerobaculia bacterium]
MRTFPLRAAGLILAACAGISHAADVADPPAGRFRLFPGEPSLVPATSQVPSAKPKLRKSFWLASAEILSLEVIPYTQNRYLNHEDYALISWISIRDNLQSGLKFDSDKFTTNQLGHTVSGALFFNAPRTNGYSFWESAPFVLAGSYVWEIVFETQKPSLNDLVNTTLGGMVSGETTYRLSQMLLDDRARGGERVLRETAAALLNPTQMVTRLGTGDLWAVRTRRGDYLAPSGFVAETDVGWRHFVSSRRADPDQALLTLNLRYGDPFERAVSRPFDSFEASLDVSAPSSALLTHVELRGLLGGWDLDPGSPGGRHVLGFFMDFDYTNNDARVFSSQSFRFGLLALRPVGKRVQLRDEVLGAGAPLVALQNDHPDAGNLLVGRKYDYGPGAAFFTAVRLRREELDILTLAYSMFWTHTS